MIDRAGFLYTLLIAPFVRLFDRRASVLDQPEAGTVVAYVDSYRCARCKDIAQIYTAGAPGGDGCQPGFVRCTDCYENWCILEYQWPYRPVPCGAMTLDGPIPAGLPDQWRQPETREIRCPNPLMHLIWFEHHVHVKFQRTDLKWEVVRQRPLRIKLTNLSTFKCDPCQDTRGVPGIAHETTTADPKGKMVPVTVFCPDCSFPVHRIYYCPDGTEFYGKPYADNLTPINMEPIK